MQRELYHLVRFFSAKTHRTVSLLVVVLFLVALPVTVLMTQDLQTVRQDASGPQNTVYVTVFNDIDGDGIQGAGEDGLGGVRISAAPQSNPKNSQTDVTHDDGNLAIPLASDIYDIGIFLPPGFAMSPNNSTYQIVEVDGETAIFFPIRENR